MYFLSVGEKTCNKILYSKSFSSTNLKLSNKALALYCGYELNDLESTSLFWLTCTVLLFHWPSLICTSIVFRDRGIVMSQSLLFSQPITNNFSNRCRLPRLFHCLLINPEKTADNSQPDHRFRQKMRSEK